jgi:hypothetical protein
MVMVIEGLTALGAVPLDAVTVKVNGPAVVGVPEMTPVAELRVKPPGTVPLETVKVGAGNPLAMNV